MVGARGSVIVAVGVLFSVLIFHCCMTHATTPIKTYFVGGHLGWNGLVSMETWPDGKKFYAGDILVFKYDPDQYNVVIVNEEGHDSCTENDGATEYDSGNDRIQLAFGANYFIDSVSGLCPLGMKMAINATARPRA